MILVYEILYGVLVIITKFKGFVVVIWKKMGYNVSNC